MTGEEEDQMRQAVSRVNDKALEDAIAEEHGQAEMTYSEVKAAVAEAANANQELQQRNLDTLNAIRSRKLRLADIRHKLEIAERECTQQEVEIVSAIKAGVWAQASMDMDELIRSMGGTA